MKIGIVIRMRSLKQKLMIKMFMILNVENGVEFVKRVLRDAKDIMIQMVRLMI